MAIVYQTFNPEGAAFHAANFPQYSKVNGSGYTVTGLAYDAATDESAWWKFVATNYASGNLTLDIWWYADTASTANVVWQAQIAAITANTDSQDIETDTMATLNFVQDTHLGTTGQRLHLCTITISNLDSLAADDFVSLKITRDADGTNATDDLAGDCLLVQARISYLST